MCSLGGGMLEIRKFSFETNDKAKPTLHLHDELSPSFQRKTYQICVHQLDLNKFTSNQKKKKEKETIISVFLWWFITTFSFLSKNDCVIDNYFKMITSRFKN